MDGLLKTGAAVAGGAIKAGQQAFENAPEVIERSSQFVGGVVKTANETQPVLKKVTEIVGRMVDSMISSSSSSPITTTTTGTTTATPSTTTSTTSIVSTTNDSQVDDPK